MRKTFESQHLLVDAEITNESFDHAFGRETKTGFEIIKIQTFIPALNTWLDVSHLSDFYEVADKLITNEMECA